MVEHHEIRPVCSTYLLDKLESEPCESIPVGNHKFLDISSHDFVQKGLKLGPVEVDPGANLPDKFVFWEHLLLQNLKELIPSSLLVCSCPLIFVLLKVNV